MKTKTLVSLTSVIDILVKHAQIKAEPIDNVIQETILVVVFVVCKPVRPIGDIYVLGKYLDMGYYTYL